MISSVYDILEIIRKADRGGKGMLSNKALIGLVALEKICNHQNRRRAMKVARGDVWSQAGWSLLSTSESTAGR